MTRLACATAASIREPLRKADSSGALEWNAAEYSSKGSPSQRASPRLRFALGFLPRVAQCGSLPQQQVHVLIASEYSGLIVRAFCRLSIPASIIGRSASDDCRRVPASGIGPGSWAFIPSRVGASEYGVKTFAHAMTPR